MEEFAVECSILKVYVSDIAQKQQMKEFRFFGGMGFSEDTPMESAWRDARISKFMKVLTKSTDFFL